MVVGGGEHGGGGGGGGFGCVCGAAGEVSGVEAGDCAAEAGERGGGGGGDSVRGLGAVLRTERGDEGGVDLGFEISDLKERGGNAECGMRNAEGAGRGDLGFEISDLKGGGGKAEGGMRNGELMGECVFVLDTLGELKKLYALASGVFVGRSLVRLGGAT